MSIIVQQPQPYDLVGEEVRIAGLAGGAFEATFEWEITEGHDFAAGHFMAGDGVGGHAQFQTVADLRGSGWAFHSARLSVFHSSARDGSRLDEVVVPILLGAVILEGYTVYDEYVVRAGDTLWSIAAARLGGGANYPLIVGANEHTIPDPDAISVGQIIRIPRSA